MSMDIFEQWNSNTDLVGLKKDIEEAKDKPLKERELKDHLIIASDILTTPPVVMHANGTGSKLNMYA